jgi:hypothetical protein
VLAADKLEDVRGAPTAISMIFFLRKLALQVLVPYFGKPEKVAKLYLRP